MGFLTGISDHGLLSGLADDDHTQYVLRNILTTDGDLFSRDAGAVTRIAAVATGQVLASAGTGTLPTWSATPTLTSLTCPTLDGGTAANDDITIQGTTHATRTTSYVILQPSGGNVGIGTATPDYPLHVFSSTQFTSTTIQDDRDVAGTPSVYMLKSRLGGSASVNDVAGMFGFTFLNNAATPAVAYAARIYGRVDRVISGTESGHLEFHTNNAGDDSERARITAAGNVGINATTPVISGTGKLHMGADTFRLDTARTPASAGAAGNAGDICWDASFIYVCTATNAWERVAIASW